MADINELLRKIAEQRVGEAPAQQKVAIAQEGELPQQADPMQEAVVESSNEDATSPYQKPKSVLIQDELEEQAPSIDPINPSPESFHPDNEPKEPTALESLKAKIAEYQNVADAKKETSSDDNAMNWLTGIGQAANVLNRASGKKTQDVKYWGDSVKAKEAAAKKAQLDKIKNVQDMYQKYIGAEDKQKAASDLKDYREAGLADVDAARKSADIYKKAQLEDTDLSREQRAKFQQDKLDEAEKDRELREKIARLSAKAKTKAKGIKLTKGQEKADTVFAKDLVAWNTGGRTDYEVNGKIFSDAINALETGKVETGTISGMGTAIPMIRTDSKELETTIRKAINGMLRATLGSQFTEKEGERIFKQTYDPFASSKSNVKNMKAEMAKLEGRKLNTEAMAEVYERDGTLQNFQTPKTKTPESKVSVITADGRRGTIPSDKVEAFLKKHPNAKVAE